MYIHTYIYTWPTEFYRPYILPFQKKIVGQIIDMNTLSVLFTKVVKIMVILLNVRILNIIIHKHLLKENNYNDQVIEIRSDDDMHTIYKQKKTCLFSCCNTMYIR